MDPQNVRAPHFSPDAIWLGVDRPLRLEEELRGQVVLLDFWTYCCVNCLHLLPMLTAIEQRFAGEVVVVIGVHSAKFDAEKDLQNIQAAMLRHRVSHPVVVDSEHELWETYGVKAWPTLVLIDAEGYLRETLPGETSQEDLIERIEALLVEAREKKTLATTALKIPPSSSKHEGVLKNPGKVLVQPDRIYIADTGHHRIVECDHRGRLTRIFGDGEAGTTDGGPESARFCDPQGMAVQDGYLVVADTGNHLLRRIELESGEVSTLAGTGRLWRGERLKPAPLPTEMPLRSPWDLVAADGILLVAMAGSHQIWLYDPARDLFGPFAGNGNENHDDGELQEASFAQPSGLALFGRYLFVADSEISSVRAVDLHEQQVQTLTGKGLFDFGDEDGPASEAKLQHPLDVCVGLVKGEPRVYVADTFNHKIKVIELEGLSVRTILGDGSTTPLYEPGGMDLFGEELLIADTNNHRLRVGNPSRGELRDFPLSR